MVALTDIAPSTRTVPVDGKDVSVFGVSAQGIASLLGEFPQLQKIFVGEQAQLTPMGLVQAVPEAVASIIAAGCGQPGDKEAIKVAARLALQAQLDLLNVIIDLTMPAGIGPFVDALNAVFVKLGLGDLTKVPGTKSA